MSFEALLAAIDEYIAARSNTEEKGANRTSDWDCGLALEFESSLARAEQNERVRVAASHLEEALNEYIDEHVQAVLRSRSSQGG
jgi:hypothetical protein